MPPKANTAAPKAGMTTEAFLMMCIKAGKEKLSVDFDRVAADTGMSAGGAANKYRGIMKKLEEEGATWAITDATKPAAGGNKRKPVAAKNKDTPKSEDGENAGESVKSDSTDEEEKPPKKKAVAGRARKGMAKKPLATRKKAAVQEKSADEQAGSGSDGEDAEREGDVD